MHFVHAVLVNNTEIVLLKMIITKSCIGKHAFTSLTQDPISVHKLDKGFILLKTNLRSEALRKVSPNVYFNSVFYAKLWCRILSSKSKTMKAFWMFWLLRFQQHLRRLSLGEFGT